MGATATCVLAVTAPAVAAYAPFTHTELTMGVLDALVAP